MRRPLVSVVVDNYNYGRFLRHAIDSALSQTWPHMEVIVVDDGSDDDSTEVIAAYGDRIRAVCKENGGQASAFNEGFERTRGDIVFFLDADDLLNATAVERVVPSFDDAELVKVHWPMSVIDEHGRQTGERHPEGPLPDGDRRRHVLETGPTAEVSPPTSGNAWSRHFLAQVFPIPEELYRISADKYLLELAPFFGTMRALHTPQSQYRRHEGSSQMASTVEERLRRELAFYDHYTDVLRRYLAVQGISVDIAEWKQRSWWYRQDAALRDITSLPAGAPVILVDDGSWGAGMIAGRPRLPFLERNGQYWGQPANDAEAIAELERMRAQGAVYLIFVWSSVWWFDHYTGLRDYLRGTFSCALESEHVVAFDLRTTGPASILAGGSGHNG